MELHREIISKYKTYQILYNEIELKDKKKFIFTVVKNNNALLRGEFTVLGSYSLKRNVWIWANSSKTLDKSMVNDVLKLRDNIATSNVSSKLKKFINSNYSVVPQLSLDSFFEDIASQLNKNILFKTEQDMYTIILINKIIYNNME